MGAITSVTLVIYLFGKTRIVNSSQYEVRPPSEVSENPPIRNDEVSFVTRQKTGHTMLCGIWHVRERKAVNALTVAAAMYIGKIATGNLIAPHRRHGNAPLGLSLSRGVPVGQAPFQATSYCRCFQNSRTQKEADSSWL